jgi:phosphotransferase system  glucose/maltose/N-acetylglucosamine-specific IIC component
VQKDSVWVWELFYNKTVFFILFLFFAVFSHQQKKRNGNVDYNCSIHDVCATSNLLAASNFSVNYTLVSCASACKMGRHLEHDYEVEEAPSGMVHHFWDTIQVLGGWKGLALLCIAIVSFYAIVVYFVTAGRAKRSNPKKRKEKEVKQT